MVLRFQVDHWPYVRFLKRHKLTNLWSDGDILHSVIWEDVRKKLDVPDITIRGSRLYYRKWKGFQAFTQSKLYFVMYVIVIINLKNECQGARVTEWLSAPAFGPEGLQFDPQWSRPLCFRDVLGQDRFS